MFDFFFNLLIFVSIVFDAANSQPSLRIIRQKWSEVSATENWLSSISLREKRCVYLQFVDSLSTQIR